MHPPLMVNCFVMTLTSDLENISAMSAHVINISASFIEIPPLSTDISSQLKQLAANSRTKHKSSTV